MAFLQSAGTGSRREKSGGDIPTMEQGGEAQLLVGTAEVDITPRVGTALAGSLWPRASEGVDDPLFVKAIVLESGGRRLAYGIFDLIAVGRAEGDRAVELASKRTGIPRDHIVWAASHTHTGPYSAPLLDRTDGDIDRVWLDGIAESFSRCVAHADATKVPAGMSRLRGFHTGLAHNRRVLFKDGRAINTWNLERAQDVQTVGSSGPIDPEIGILAFDDAEGRLLAVLFHFALHTNTNFGPRFSADYPGVVAAQIRDGFGEHVSTLFTPGTFADQNSTGPRYQAVGEALSTVISGQLERRAPATGATALGALKREVTVPYRDFSVDQEERIRSSGWSPEAQDVFRREVQLMRERGETEATTVLQAWRIGDVGFVSLPGEPFVELGLRIKRESPFAWTYPVGYAGDHLGYLVTPEAWEAGGYESLIARSARPSAEGVSYLVDEALDLLRTLYDEGRQQ